MAMRNGRRAYRGAVCPSGPHQLCTQPPYTLYLFSHNNHAEFSNVGNKTACKRYPILYIATHVNNNRARLDLIKLASLRVCVCVCVNSLCYYCELISFEKPYLDTIS